MDYWWLIFLIVSIINYAVATPFIVYYLVKFIRYKTYDVVAKRKPKLVISFSILALVNILIIRTYFAILSNLTYDGHHVGLQNDPRIRTPAIWVTQLSANLLFSRLWIMFYDWRRAVHILELKWSKQLLSKHHQSQHWTLKFGFIGNEHVLILYSIIHYVVGVVVCVIAIEVNDGENGLAYDLIYFVDSVIVCVPYIVLSFVSQRFHDSIGVRDEIRGIAMIFMIGVLGFGILGYMTKESAIRSQVAFAWSSIISVCIVLRVLYVKQLEAYLRTTLSLATRHLAQSMSARDVNDTAKYPKSLPTKKVYFTDVLKHEEGFKIFANHLLKEYSVETLLFLLELAQIKTAIISHYRELFASHNAKQYSNLQQDIEKAIGTMTFQIDIAPQILHLSDDAYKDITIEKVINLWQYLYYQYINESSNSCINISHYVRLTILKSIAKHNINTRNSVKAKMNPLRSKQHKEHAVLELTETESNTSSNMKSGSYKLECHTIVMELITAFDIAAKEVYCLLERDSWHRFRSTPEFFTWKKQFFDTHSRKFTLS